MFLFITIESAQHGVILFLWIGSQNGKVFLFGMAIGLLAVTRLE